MGAHRKGVGWGGGKKNVGVLMRFRVEPSISRTDLMLITFSEKLLIFIFCRPARTYHTVIHFLTKFLRNTLIQNNLITLIVFCISVTAAFKSGLYKTNANRNLLDTQQQY